jgi:putative colanic acid biosynthesis UDP-glucose lipid carrier transferase
MDVTISLGALIVLAPLLIGVAIAVKRGSPGPVLFRQRRYGLDGREINVYKFRTMTVCENGDSVRQASRNDMRVTPIGKHLRRWSIDELPQLINVLQGTMSIVGPRPHAVAHNEAYRKLIKRYMVRHKVLPGITGWRKCADVVAKLPGWNTWKLACCSIWSTCVGGRPMLDLEIILATAVAVIRTDNAY